MCTVSFIPKGGNNFIFTSNRDEAIGRKTIIPKIYNTEGLKIWMPKDALAAGTWIGVANTNRLVCLLNGAFKKHVKKEKYRHSRGQIVKQFLSINEIPTLEKLNASFFDIEPFTLLVVDWSEQLCFTEIVWDGTSTTVTKQNPNEAKIWSSSTLYTDEMKVLREKWFADFIKNTSSNQETVLDFHQNYEVGDNDVNLQIDRGNLKTVSITSIANNNDQLSFQYIDLLKKQQYKTMTSTSFKVLKNA